LSVGLLTENNTIAVQFSRISVLYLLALLIVFTIGCNRVSEISNAEDHEPKSIPVHARIVSADSSQHPTVIPIDESKLRHSELIPVQARFANMNEVPAGDPIIRTLTQPRKIELGSDTFKMPEVVPATPVVVNAKQPKPVNSLPLRMKDGASYNIQYLDVDQGMNSSYIWDIFEDNSGNFWFATDGGGVTRYDGKSFLHLTEEHGLISNYVRKIIQDRSGNLWFATISGLSKYDGVTFTNYDKKSGLKHNSIWSVLEDEAGNIWLSTYGGGVSKFDGSNFTHYTTQQGLASNMVWTICEGPGGMMWFGTNGAGLCGFDGSAFTTYSVENGLPDSTILAINVDIRGNLDLGTQGGYAVLTANRSTIMIYTTEQGLSSNIVRSIYQGETGPLLLGTYGNGVVAFDGLSFTRLSTEEGLSDGHIVSMQEDGAGNIWFATYGGGVCKYNPRSFQHYTDKQNLPNFFVWSVAQDTAGQIWYGTNHGGVIVYDGFHYEQYTTKEGLCSDVVRAVMCADDGSYWFGTYGGGITRMKNGKLTYFTTEDGLCDNNVLDIRQDRSGNIWIATDGGGVSVYDGKSFTNYGVAQGLTSNYIRAMMEDSKGNIWLGTHAGLCSFDTKTKNITRYNEDEGIVSFSTLWCVTEDDAGGIWFGSGGYGAIRFNGNYFTYYSEREGLSNSSVWSMVKDRDGRIWMGTERGLNCVVTNGDSVVSITEFHREDGLKAEDFYLKSAFLDKDNQMWWGTGKALTTLDMNNFGLNDFAPKVQLNNIFIREEFIDYRELKSAGSAVKNVELKRIAFDSIQPFTNHPDGLELPYSLNHLTFYFSATEWSAPHAVQYEYQLEGLDPDWSQPTAENKADYRNIPYGDYTFRVRAKSSSGSWSNEVSYPFVIHPPWWHTWWARTIGGIVILALIYSYMRYRERALQARQKELKHKVNEATSEIKHQKHLIEEKHKAITDSINYAERIQRSFLATKDLLDANLKDYFVLYLPKDVVSGDFYWASKLNDGNFALATADSTGHGVPGAIMSLLNITSLEKAVEHETDPAKILNHTRRNIIERLSRDGTKDGGWDGMDCSFISFDFVSLKIKVAAANNPVWIARDGVLHEIKADRFPVGKHEFDDQSFTNRDFELKKGDMIYTMTDGYADQFGGPLGKKFKWKQLQKVLLSHVNLPLPEQKEKVGEILHQWKSHLEQIDDICLIGIRIS
jgi:ligand-binding sensor domain-containing protein/serine phosphatase RsbU (regulator of sigma subunit)